MAVIKVKAPAKINLTLEIVGKYPNGFHELKSIMATVNLYDYLTCETEALPVEENKIVLSGNSSKIPYDNKNIVYKATEKFFEKAKLQGQLAKIYIEKNIPVEAGLAGGSTDGAGILKALNAIYNEPLTEDDLNDICQSLGSDLNFCLKGGICLCEGRGEVITPLPYIDLNVSLIKPKNFGISAKEAYTKYSLMTDKPKVENTFEMKKLIEQGKFDEKLLVNHLEMAVINDYPILTFIKEKESAMLSGSGPTMFCLKKEIKTKFDDDILVIENLKTTKSGVEVINNF